MKMLRPLSLTLLLLLLPLVSFAANKKSINLPEPVKVGTTVLQPGDYTVQWDGKGPSVQVNFKQNKKVLASAPATVENQKASSTYNGAVDLKSEQGSEAKTLQAISFKDMSLVFGQATSSATQ